LGWQFDFPVKPLLVTPELVVADWYCPGEARAWSPERARYHQIELPTRGAHVRRFGRAQSIVDATQVAVDRPGEEFVLCSPSAHAQRSTLVFWRGDLAAELDRAGPARVLSISPFAARLHLYVLAARDTMEMEERALSMIHHLTAGDGVSATAPKCSPAWRRLAEDTRHVLATRYGERLTVADLAVACKSSPFHLSRVFRAVYGLTLHRQLNRVRLRASLFELRHGSDDLVRIALDAGFSSHSHFARAFRLEFGVTPSACRAIPVDGTS
jgi:AraC-like DNA-binding protein